ncbi:MAG TPA: hypothetical protein VF035_01395 [Longimicrobiales bacterium]
MLTKRHAVHAAIAVALVTTACDRTETASLDQQSDFRCAVTLTDGVELERDSTGLWDAGESATMAAGGTIVAASKYGANLLAWHPDGTRWKAIGSRGRGPGEFSGAALQIFAGKADTLHVYDGTHWFLLDSALNLIAGGGSRPQAIHRYAHFLDDGTILTTRPIGDMRQYFTVSSRDGEILRSFGDIDSTWWSQAAYLARPSSHPRDGRFWTVPASMTGEGYVLEQWNTEGKREAHLQRNVPWMPTADAATKAEGRPAPQFGVVHEDSTGLLWVLAMTPGDNWHINPEKEPTPEDIFAMLTYHLEVIDPAEQKILASSTIDRIEDIPSAFLGNGRTALFHWEDSTGTPHASVREYQLTDQAGSCPAVDSRG